VWCTELGSWHACSQSACARVRARVRARIRVRIRVRGGVGVRVS